MSIENKNKPKILLWVSIVYILSLICYVPMLLEQNGIKVANGFLLLKYLFVCIPAIISVLILACEHKLKEYFVQMFSGKISIKNILMWLLFAAVGLLVLGSYSLITKDNVFQNTYTSITALLSGCIYLFITGFAEETAWRGFLLERISSKEKNIRNIIIAGIIWAIWHMPMWIIRNSLSAKQVICFCIWTVLVSIVLGAAYYQCRNILFTSLLHMTFNICYLAPIQYNIIVLAIITAIGIPLCNKHNVLEK